MVPVVDHTLQPPKVNVLIISDEPESARVWGFTLNQAGIDVTLIAVSDPVMATWENERPDMIVIEDFNKENEELTICEQLRAVSAVPILFLTVRLDERSQLDIYKAGADDCITFPITPRLFQAKVHAWLRRTQSIPINALDEVRAGDFMLNAGQKCLTLPGGTIVHLTILESRLLFVMMTDPGRLLDSAEITNRVWGYCGEGDSGLLKNLVYRVRKKIEPNPNQPRYLITEGSSGYRFTV